MNEIIKEMLKGSGCNDYDYYGKIGNKEIYLPYVKNEIGYVCSVRKGLPRYILCENGVYSWFTDINFEITNLLPYNEEDDIKDLIYKKLHSKIKEEEIFREHDKLFEKYFKDDKYIFSNKEEKKEYNKVLKKVYDIIEKYEKK